MPRTSSASNALVFNAFEKQLEFSGRPNRAKDKTSVMPSAPFSPSPKLQKNRNRRDEHAERRDTNGDSRWPGTRLLMHENPVARDP